MSARLSGALDAVRRLGVRLPVTTLGADRGGFDWRGGGPGVAVRASAVRLRSVRSEIQPGHDGSVVVHDTNDVLDGVRSP